jgi:anti-sigma factor RsiW
MNNPDNQRLLELAWRRRLTEAELAELRAACPEVTADAETEAALSDALGRLPDAPVPSNFTARVLQGLERETLRPAPRRRDWKWVWRILVPRIAVAMVILGVSVFGYHRHQAVKRRAFGESMWTVTAVQSLPSPQILEDFDVIQKLDTTPPADKDLLALLQ